MAEPPASIVPAPQAAGRRSWRRRFEGQPLSRRLLWATVAVIVAAVAVAMGGLWDRHERELGAARQQLGDFSFALAELTERALDAADLILRATEQDVFHPADGARPARERLDSLLRARISGLPPVQGHTAVDAGGHILSTSRPTVTTVDIAAIKGFRYIARSGTADTFITPAFHYDGLPRPVISVVRRVAAPDGAFLGVVAVGIEPEYFNAVFSTLRQRHSYRIRLLRTDGVVIAGEGVVVYRPEDPAPLPLAVVPSGIGGSAVRAVMERHEPGWIVAAAYLPRFPLVVEAALPRDDVLAAWRRQAWVIGAVALLACTLAAVLAVGLCRELSHRERAERRLSFQSQLLQTVFDTVPHPIFVKDAQGRYLEVNRAMADAWGMTPGAFKGRHIIAPEARDPAEVAANLADDRAVLAGGREVAATRATTLSGGQVRQFHVIRRPLRDEAGAVTGLVGIAVDETERRAAEERLRASQHLLETIFDTIPHHIWMKNRQGQFVHANRALLAYLGTPLEGIQGRRIVGGEFRPPEENARILEEDRRVLEEGASVENTHWYAAPNGSRRHFHVVKRPLRDAAGTITGLVAVAMDITAHSRAEEALYHSQTLLKAVFDAIPLALLVKNLEGRLLMVNAQTAERWGLTPEQMAGLNVREMEIPADEMRVVEETDARVVQENRILDYELKRTMPDGRVRLLRAIKAPLHGPDGRVTGILGISEDITEHRRMEEDKAALERQRQQVQKMDTVGRLAGGVAHDFNNLLTPVIGFVDLALTRIGPDDPLRQELGMIREAAARAGELTRGLLSFSRSQVMTLRPVNLNEEVRALHRMLSRVIGEGIGIVLNLDPALGAVEADATQMQQVLMNLAVNARDAMPGGGKLVIETRNLDLDAGYAERVLQTEPGPYVMVSVSDTGVGMSAETQARIFEPFFTTKEPGKGTGLGLSIVYGIVRQHRGAIRVYSEPGRGTSFKVLLPRLAAGAAPAEARQRPLSELKGRERVLVVEDEARVREAVCALLASLGYDVIQAPAPGDALGLLENGKRGDPHLLLTDIMLPGQSGGDFYKALRRRMPGLRVLYMSGYPRGLLAEAGAIAGPGHFIGKPFGLAELAEKVREVLEAPAAP